MACSKLQRHCAYDTFYQAIENYDIKSLVREAANKRILSDVEKSEIEQHGSRHLMRECLINLILYRGARAQQFADFIQDFSRRAYEECCRQLAGFRPNVATNVSTNDVGCSHAGRELPQLSQDSSNSGGSTSPMELDTKQVESKIQDNILGHDDVGYFSNSGGSLSNDPVYDPGSSMATQPSYTSTYAMENELKRLQGIRGHIRRYVSNKQQNQVPVFNFPSSSGESSQTTPSAVNNYTVNVFNLSRSQINSYSGHNKTGSQFCDDSPCIESIQSQEKRWESEWSCLKEHHCRIIEYLNVNTLLPHLWQKGLLTPSEREALDSMHKTPRKQAKYLLKILPGKGKCGFKLFLECLRDEKDHLGHEELVKCLN